MSAGLEMLSALSPTERIEFLSGLPAEEAKEILEIVDELDLREMRSKCSTNRLRGLSWFASCSKIESIQLQCD